MQQSESCSVLWDGVDFTACARERYIDNIPLAILVGAAVIVSASRLSNLITTSVYRNPSVAKLTSLSGEADLAELESTVILSSVASNLLPGSSNEKSTGESLPEKESEEVIGQFLARPSKQVKWFSRIKWLAGVIGALAWSAVVLAACIHRGSWKRIALPAFVLLLSFLPRPPIAPILTVNMVPTLITLRSSILHGASALDIVALSVAIGYWAAMMAMPYAQPMSGLLLGAGSKGGGSSGNFGKDVSKHIEEPTSAFARAAYTFMLPFLAKHYFSPITLDKIPRLREDDASASALGAWRAFQARKDAKWAENHLGEKRKRDLGLDLFLFFWPEISAQCMWALIFICLQYCPPTGLRLLLKFVTERDVLDTPTHVAYVYIAIMAGGQILGIATMAQSLYIGRRVCIRVRSIIIAEVFTKALRQRDDATPATKEGEAKRGTGQIANLVANDAFNISEICAYIYYMVSCPFAIILNSVLLYNTLGYASFAGIAVLLVFLPIGGFVGRRYQAVQKEFMAATDKRLESVTEVIAHVKLIKFNAWEGKFFDRMMETRRKELAVLARRMVLGVTFSVLAWGTPVIVTAVAFAVHALVLKEPLTADRAFASLILFNLLRDPLALVQDTFVRLLNAYTSCGRIQTYLDEPETLKYRQITPPGPRDPAVGFRKAVIGYSSKESADSAEFTPFQLGPITVSFPPGSLSIVVGPVGSGKTTLINSLLGETTLLDGQVFMPNDHANRDVCPRDPNTGLTDTVAYCSQTPWLIGASIRENITFGSPFNRRRYEAVIEACALERDLEIFELGDETEVGEKGTTCSGGQKARIALARAVYSRAKTVILDDVLSAVDAQTARHLYVQCLQGRLIRNRTVILVTHAVSLVAPAAQMVVMLDDGQVVASGPPAKLLAEGKLEMTEEMESQVPSASSTLIAETPAGELEQGFAFESDLIEENLDGIEGDALDTQKAVDAVDAEDPEASAKERARKRLVAEETQRSGAVGRDTYKLYIAAMGRVPFWTILWAVMIMSQVMQVSTNAWIKDWANSNKKVDVMLFQYGKEAADRLFAEMSKGHSTQWYLGIYLALSGAYLVTIAARVGTMYFGSLRAGRGLYSRLLTRILGAKMRFFDATPSGRITNRLSKDIATIDTETGEFILHFIVTCLSCAAVFAVIVFTTPLFIFAVIGIFFIYWLIGVLFVTTNREIKRYDSVTRSPILVSFSEVLNGMVTIRSYGDSARFIRKLFHELDQNSRCFWYLWQCNRILNNLTTFAGAFVTIFAAVLAINTPGMDAGAVGLSVTYALQFSDFVLWIVRMYAAVEMSLNSVERVGEYLDLEVEEEKHSRGTEPPAYWPSRTGSVEVRGLTCKYAPQLDPVLKDVSFTIGPREKIGVCGRTGSGKSTLALSFFRFLHQESGSIVIDGLDIKQLSLAALRSRLTILPQEAQLFSGSVRENLDPFNEYEDADIWEALKQCGLAGRTPGPSRAATRPNSKNASRVDLAKLAHVNGNGNGNGDRSNEHLRAAVGKSLTAAAVDAPKDSEDAGEEEEGMERVTIRSLDEEVAVGGKNFSQGQRQLLALARGLLKLRQSSFLIMDESTANLDHATDQTIQNVLRENLADTQMLVIAHRLMTVCGLDKILVLDHGKVVEFGTPWELIKANGAFRDLVKQSGEENTLIEASS